MMCRKTRRQVRWRNRTVNSRYLLVCYAVCLAYYVGWNHTCNLFKSLYFHKANIKLIRCGSVGCFVATTCLLPRVKQDRDSILNERLYKVQTCSTDFKLENVQWFIRGDWKCKTWKMQDLENDGPSRRAWKCRSCIFQSLFFFGPPFSGPANSAPPFIRPLHIGDPIRGAPWRVMFEISSKVATTHYTVPFCNGQVGMWRPILWTSK